MEVYPEKSYFYKTKFLCHKNKNLNTTSKTKSGTSASTPKGPQKTTLKQVRILPRTVETSGSNSSDDHFLYPSASQNKRQLNLAAISCWKRSAETLRESEKREYGTSSDIYHDSNEDDSGSHVIF